LKTVSKYVILDTLRIFVLALLVFTAIFFVASSVAATREGMTLSQFLRITPFIALYVIRFTLPLSLVVGVTLALGRMETDREILALRACGVHMGTVAAPLLVLALAFSAGLYVFNDRMLPVCDYMRRDVLKSFAREILTLQKGRNKFFKLPGYNVFCKEYDGRTLGGLMVFRDDPELPFEIMARKGMVWLSRDETGIIIALEDVRITHYGEQGKASYGEMVSEDYSIYIPMRQRTRQRPEFLTLAQIKAEIRSLQDVTDSWEAAIVKAKTKQEEQRIAEDLNAATYLKRRFVVEYHKRGASALTPFLFLLVGIPMPLLLRSRGRLVPAFVALMAVMVTYFAVSMAGESFAEKGSLDPWFAMWLGDIFTAIAGVFLFWRLFEK
jgi:lipopolysaccharide export LptBFGC system permease protein LptF